MNPEAYAEQQLALTVAAEPPPLTPVQVDWLIVAGMLLVAAIAIAIVGE